MYHSLNASAAPRTAEVFGVQHVHIIEETAKFHVQQGIAKGAGSRLDMHRYKDISACYAVLKERGYRIVATVPREDALLLEDLPLGRPCALVFGTEDRGLSVQAVEQADLCVKIPMFGFTQSLNVSVCVALFLYQIRMKLENSSIDWQLSPKEREELRHTFVQRLLY